MTIPDIFRFSNLKVSFPRKHHSDRFHCHIFQQTHLFFLRNKKLSPFPHAAQAFQSFFYFFYFYIQRSILNHCKMPPTEKKKHILTACNKRKTYVKLIKEEQFRNIKLYYITKNHFQYLKEFFLICQRQNRD